MTTPLDWLAETKFRPPIVQPGAIGRAVLPALAAGARSHRVTLLSAPAGYGKTSLLAALARSGDLPVAWFTVDADDDDPARWLLGLARALDGLLPDDATLPVAGPADADPGASLRGDPGGTHRFVAALLNRLDAAVPAPFLLVLDDLHLVTRPEIHDALGYLVERMPPRMHLAISTRYDPPLRLARLRAARELFELRAADLRLRPEEAARLIAATLGGRPSHEAIERLRDQAEGWPAGLVLLASAAATAGVTAPVGAVVAAGAPPVARGIRDRGLVFAFLAEEVLAGQEPEVRRFLLETSILPELTPARCEAVTGQADARATMELLLRRNLFLTALVAGEADDELVCRYHALFAEFLRGQLRRERPGDVAGLHLRAAAAEPLPARAIEHWLQAGAPDRAATELEGVADRLILQGQLTTVLGWLAALPEATYRAHPRLLYVHAVAAVQKGDEAGIVDVLDRALAEARRAGDRTMEAEIDAARASFTFIGADFACCAVLVDEALRLPHRPATGILLTMLEASLALFVRGDLAAASAGLDRALAAVRASDDPEATLYMALLLGPEFTVLPGALDAIEAFCLAAAARPEAPGGPIELGVADVLAAIRLRRGDLDGAIETGQRALARKGELGGYLFLGLNAALAAATASSARHDFAGARRYLEIMRRQIGQAALNRTIQANGLYPYGRQCWLEGRIDETRRISEELEASATELPGFHRVLRLLLRGMLQLSEQAYPAAESTLREAARLEGDEPVAAIYGSAQVLLARLYWTWRRPQEALDALEAAMAACETAGTPGRVVAEGPIVLPILRHAARHGRNAAYARRLLAMLGEQADEAASSAGSRTLGPVSGREAEVIRLIAAGASNGDIATQLGITLPTVKSHVAHIMDKLDASSRTQVVARAREGGLLP